MLGIIKAMVITCLFLAYPYLIYRGIESSMVWVAPALFSGIYLMQSFASRNVKTKIFKALVSIGLLLGQTCVDCQIWVKVMSELDPIGFCHKS